MSTDSTDSPATNNIHDPTIFQINGLLKIKLSQFKYFTFTVIGIALLWPWNCFLSASAYYGERFVNSPSLVKVYLDYDECFHNHPTAYNFTCHNDKQMSITTLECKLDFTLQYLCFCLWLSHVCLIDN